jgi:hypothetical protein
VGKSNNLHTLSLSVALSFFSTGTPSSTTSMFPKNKPAVSKGTPSHHSQSPLEVTTHAKPTNLCFHRGASRNTMVHGLVENTGPPRIPSARRLSSVHVQSPWLIVEADGPPI